MAPNHSFICFLTLAFNFVHAAPWIATDIYEQDVYTRAYLSEAVTNIARITPTATLPAEALSAITSTDTLYSYTIIEKLYPTGYGVERYNDYGYYSLDKAGNYHTTVYKVNMTYSAPTGCSTQWTTTSAVAVIPPTEIANLLPRETVASSTSIDNSQPFQPTTYLYDVVYVDPTQVPSSELSSLSYYNKPTASYNGAGCQYTGSDGYSSGYYGGYYGYGYYDDGDWFTSKWGMGIGISGLALILICILGWAGLFFFLGMIEAWVRFRRLMTGWQTRRGFPLFWAFSCFPISLFFLFCFRKGFRARSREDAEILKKRWDEMGFGTKLRLYFVWGFRFKYPTVLGPAPARVQGSKRPNESGPRLLETPPGTTAPSRDGSERAPEMTQPGVQATGGLTENRDAEIGQAR
ncbi:unnamed protein product [Penicillium salamii]|uniref:Uncharacterized protein n=1 Tax=Penicillium salamii TaxID=1612424 RepID=A0A9W4NV99_9EURO|nr:unnamed protein product [Penicillium salamii]CAG8208987.1 unnamed protein product [Penicillium salamii]CAG8209260.1 unnamed protein product [Penicillium salamii]CAG8211976.1 unnamed protein product [Penicillium salamii]CAG8216770.1 unnamed protein product [Penicillium salamii]